MGVIIVIGCGGGGGGGGKGIGVGWYIGWGVVGVEMDGW